MTLKSSGLMADFTKNRLHQPRSFCVTLASLAFFISQMTCIGVDDVRTLWKASALLGLAYGSMYGLYPTIIIEYFGMRVYFQLYHPVSKTS